MTNFNPLVALDTYENGNFEVNPLLSQNHTPNNLSS